MNNPNFAPITDEQREQAKQQRLIDQEYARNNLKINYVDQPHWVTLAAKYNSKLPGWWYPSSDIKYLRRIAKKANFDLNLFVDSTGCSNIKEWVNLNSNYTALGAAGSLLEYIDEYFTNPPVFPVEKTSESRKKVVS